MRKRFPANERRERRRGAPPASGGKQINAIPGDARNQSAADFLQRTALDAQISSDKILAIARKYKSNMPYPPSQLAG